MSEGQMEVEEIEGGEAMRCMQFGRTALCRQEDPVRGAGTLFCRGASHEPTHAAQTSYFPAFALFVR